MFDWFVIETIPLLNVVGPRIWSVFVLVQKQAVIAFVKDTFLAPYIRRPRPPFFDYCSVVQANFDQLLIRQPTISGNLIRFVNSKML